MLRNKADARRCSYFELGLPVTWKRSQLKKGVAIDFYRLTDVIDTNKNVIIESYWLIDLFSYIVIYRLHWPGLLFNDCSDRAIFQMNYS